MGPIHADLFAQNNVLLPGVEVRLKLHRSKDAFCLTMKVANPDYRVRILDAVLYVRKLTCSDTHVLPTGTQDMQRDNVFLGELPKRLVLCLVNTASFNGSYVKNPFRFQPFGVNYVALHVDEKQYPATPLTPNFTTQTDPA